MEPFFFALNAVASLISKLGLNQTKNWDGKPIFSSTSNQVTNLKPISYVIPKKTSILAFYVAASNDQASDKKKRKKLPLPWPSPPLPPSLSSLQISTPLAP